MGAPYIMAPLVAALAATVPAFAQERSHEHRLVEAFSAYCVATAAEPGRVQAAIEATGKFRPNILTFENGGMILSAELLPLTSKTNPHQRMLITYGWGLGDRGRKRSCQVNLPWGEKEKLVAELIGSLKVDEGTSSVVREGRYDTDVTRWAIRVGNSEAVVELGLPTFAGAPGRTLTLSLEN